MQEENKNLTNVSSEVDDMTEDYIATIKELKQKTVDKDKYDALKAENKKLLEAVVNGREVETPENQEKLESRDVYYKRYKENKFSSNLEYWDNFLKLRKATIKEHGLDPCVTGNYGLTPDGNKIEPSYGETEAIEAQMSTIEKFIKESEGNPVAFDALMQSAIPRK